MRLPFLINSNLCTSEDECVSYNALMKTIAGNSGNSYISYALIREVCGAYRKVPQIKSIYDYDFARAEQDAEYINANCSHAFLVLQDQIRVSESYGLKLPYAGIIRFLKLLRVPIVVVGLGANSLTGFDSDFYKKLPEDLVAFLRELASLTPMIGVRGDFTNEVLSRLGVKNVETIGCPTYYENGPKRTIEKRGIRRLASSSCISSAIIAKADVYFQDRLPHDDRVIRAIAFGEANRLPVADLEAIAARRYYFFSDIAGWKNSMASNDFFVGARVHGGMIALNSGVPAVVMNRDSRAREMCEYLNIPYLPDAQRSSDIEAIYDACDYSRMNREYPEKYAKFVRFMAKNGVTVVNPLPDSEGEKQPSLNLYGELKCKAEIKSMKDAFKLMWLKLKGLG